METCRFNFAKNLQASVLIRILQWLILKQEKEYPASEKRTWAITKDTFEYYYNIGAIVFPDDYEFLNISKPYARKFKSDDDKNGKLSSVISDFAIQDFMKSLLYDCKNMDGNSQIDGMFGRDKFDYAKPENLIKSILEVATEEGDLVLDFFLGSGTTCAVAHKMNRRYIGVDQMDYINQLAVERLKKSYSWRARRNFAKNRMDWWRFLCILRACKSKPKFC